MTTLNTTEMEALTFMAEEEKLAFDVYTALADIWEAKIFTNIATKSETKHIESVQTLATEYGIYVPQLPAGEYESPELQALYNELVAIGSRSLVDALKVGIVIEVVDMEDLTNYLEGTTNTELESTFTTLLTDSEKHLSEFTKNLEKNGETLSSEEALVWLESAIDEVYTPNIFEATINNDIIVGTDGLADTLSYQSGAIKGVTVNLSVSTAQVTGGSGMDSITGIENLIGSKFADKLTGNDGDNQLSGMVGNDILTGGLGADTLTGGEGKDKFVLKTLDDSGVTIATMDVITDFTAGKDVIDLSALDANLATKFNNKFTGFIDAGTEFTKAGQLKFEDGILYGNVDADAEADFAIALTGVTELTMANIIA